MCGRLNVDDSPFVRELMQRLAVAGRPRARRNVAPGATSDIVLQQGGERRLQEAWWSLLIEPRPGQRGYRPNPKWRTFNARSTRLNSSRLWTSAFRRHRAIIPASCFFEWQERVCYAVEPVTAGIAFAGLYRHWQFEQDSVYSFSIITLPGQPDFQHIHAKSFPLMLSEAEYDDWLDPGIEDPAHFTGLLDSGIRSAVRVTPVGSPQGMDYQGNSEVIGATAG